MSSIATCVKKYCPKDRRAEFTDALKAYQEAHLADKVDPKEARAKAVDDAIAEYREERDKIMAQVMAKMPKVAQSVAKSQTEKAGNKGTAVEVDNTFLKTPSGQEKFGEITPEIAKEIRREAGEIRLIVGNSKEGLIHIEKGHGKQIKDKGFQNVEAFVSDITSGYNEIRKGEKGALIVAKRNGQDLVAYVKLEPSADGTFYFVKSATLARKEYLEGKELLWKAAPQPSAASTTSTPNALMGDDKSPPLSGQSNSDKETISPSSEKNKANTEDSGEELTYNKRNRSTAGLKWDDIKDRDEALKVKEAVKAKVYPKPDYETLAEGDEVKKVTTHILKQVYDGIGAKPYTAKAATDEDLQRYIAAVNRVMAATNEWLNSENAKAWLRKIGETAARRSNANRGPIVLSELMEKSEPSISLYNAIYPNGWKESRDEVVILGGNRFLKSIQPGLNEVIKAFKDIEQGWPGKVESWRKQGYTIAKAESIIPDYYEGKDNKGKPYVAITFSLKNDAGKHIEYRSVFVNGPESKTDRQVIDTVEKEKADITGKFILLSKSNRFVSVHTTEQEATTAAEEKVKRQKNTIKEEGMAVSAAERTGIDYRLPGEDISSDRLQETFGFKGINFGNWMKGKVNEPERQLHLNHAFDSFMDLAALLNVPPKAISLDGLLGIAIGAQGTSGALAHFVPGVNEINLTRVAGAGSVAHEWAHGLDHYFARQAGLARSANPFLTEVQSRRSVTGDIRQEILAHFEKIVTTMEKRQATEEEVKLMAETNKNRAVKSVERWAKSVKDGMLRANADGLTAQRNGKDVSFVSEVERLTGKISSLDLSEGKVAIGPKPTRRGQFQTFFSPELAELRDLYKQAIGRTYNIDDLKALQSSIDYAIYSREHIAEVSTHIPQKTTDYKAESDKIDQEKKGKPYWGTTLEMFARAFSAYVTDRLKAANAKNTYLSRGGKRPGHVPLGTDREAINTEFDALVKEIKTRETDKGVALYSKSLPPANRADTPAELRSKLGKGYDALVESGKLRIVATQKEALRIIDMLRGGVKYAAAWHGSPHKFDKFDISHLGSGEGAQAYGYGLYFAGAKEVANYYRNTLSSDSWSTIEGEKKHFDLIDSLVKAMERGGELTSNSAMRNVAGYIVDSVRESGSLKKYLRDYEVPTGSYERMYILANAEIERLKAKPQKGQLYKVELAPTEDQYLLWDKPLSEQSETVKAALKKAGYADFSRPIFNAKMLQKYGKGWASKEGRKQLSGYELGDLELYEESDNKEDSYRDISGQEFYQKLANEWNQGGPGVGNSMQSWSQQKASELLHSLGIRGIKFLDGASRGKGEGQFNYVIFNDADIEIVEVLYSSDNKTIQGFASQGVSYLVSDGIASGKAWSVLVHESGTHINRLLQNDKQFKAILGAIDKRKDEQSTTGQAIRDAYDRVPKGTNPEHITEEVLAYLCEAAPETGIVRRFIAMIKRALVRMGLSPNIFSAQDLAALADIAVHSAAKDSLTTGSGSVELRKGENYATNARIFAERLSERIARRHESKPRILSESERIQLKEELELSEFFDDYRPGRSGLLLDPSLGEVGYTSDNDRGYATGEERVANFKRWFRQSLSEVGGVPMVFWQSSETFGSGDAKTFSFDDSFLGSNVPHPRTQFGPSFLPVEKQADWYKGTTRGFYLRIENPLILDYQESERRFKTPESAIAFANRMENLEGYDSIYIPGSRFIHIFDSNQAKFINNSGEFGSTKDVRFSVAPTANTPTATSTPPDRIDRLAAKFPKFADQWERFIYRIIDKDDPRRRVQNRAASIDASENLSKNTDILTVERLRGKKTADEVEQFMEKDLKPLLKHLAQSKLAPADLEEYAYALHVPERNLRMRQVNAKGMIDRVAKNLNTAENKALEDELVDIRSDVIMSGGGRAELQDKYLEVLGRQLDSPIQMRAELDAAQQALDSRVFTPAEIAKGTPETLQKRLDNREEHIAEIEKIRDRWETESVRFAGITDAEATTILNKWRRDPRYAAVKEANKQLAAMNQKKLDILRESGQLSDLEYKSLVDGYEHYVPLHRDVEDDSRPATGRVTGPTGSPLQVAKGSMKEVVHILAHSARNVQTAINRKHKADGGRILYNFAKENPEAGIEIGKQKKNPTHDKEGNVVLFTSPREADNELSVRVDGERYTLSFDTKNATTKRFLESIKEVDNSISGPVQALSKVTRLLATVNTTLSPEFVISNFVRDIQTAGIHMEDSAAKGLQLKALKNVFPAIKGILKSEYGKENTYWGRVYRDFAKNGGKIGWMQSYDNIKDLANQIESTMNLYKDGHIPKKALHVIGDAITKTNMAVENGVRLAVYDQLIKAGATPSKAALTAANLTVDFTRRGSYSPTINALYMFFNAGVQGNVRMIKAFHRSGKVKVIVGGIVATGFALQMLAYMSGGDDDTGQPYVDGIPDFIKERNMVFMKPGTKGEYHKIPMPYGYNVFYNSGSEIARAVYSSMAGIKYNAWKGATRMLNIAMSSFNPLQSATMAQALTPTILDPIIMNAENKTWSGSDLMPKESPYGVNKADAYRVWKSTGAIPKYIAQGLHRLTGGKGEYDNTAIVDVSPETIELMYDTFTGSAGRFVKNTISFPYTLATKQEGEKLDVNKIPFVRRVYGAWSERSITERYREQVDQVERFKKDYTSAGKEERKDMTTDDRYKMVNIVKESEGTIDKLREAKGKAEKAGKPTTLIDQKIIKIQTEFLKRTRQWEN